MIYAEKFPEEVRLAIDGLSGRNDVGYAVMMLLVEEESLQFKEIEQELDVHSQTLSNAVNQLQDGGLIEKKAGDRIGDQSTGEYVITKFGDRILDCLYQATQPGVEVGTERTLSEVSEDLPQYHRNESTDATSGFISELMTLLGEQEENQDERSGHWGEIPTKQSQLDAEEGDDLDLDSTGSISVEEAL